MSRNRSINGIMRRSHYMGPTVLQTEYDTRRAYMSAVDSHLSYEVCEELWTAAEAAHQHRLSVEAEVRRALRLPQIRLGRWDQIHKRH